MGKNPYHLYPYSQLFFYYHADQVAGCKSCSIRNIIYIMIKVLHNLAYGGYPNQNFKKSKNGSNASFTFGYKDDPHCSNRYIANACKKNQYRHYHIAEKIR